MRPPALLAVLALALTACGSDESSTSSSESGAAAFEVTTTEFELALSGTRIEESGRYDFEIVNAGELDHAFAIKGQDVEKETMIVRPDAETTLSVELAEGTYELFCPIADHADKGMTAAVTVGGRDDY